MTTHDTPEAEPQWSALDEVEMAEKDQIVTHDTPEAALAAALHRAREFCNPWASEVGHQTIHEEQAAAILAAMPDWRLVSADAVPVDAERLRAQADIDAIEAEIEAAARARITAAVRRIDPDDYADGEDARTAVNILDHVIALVERP